MRPVRLTGSPSLICGVFAEQHRADAVFFEVERDAEHAVREFEHLARHGALAAVHARDAVAERHHGADFGHVHRDGEAADLLANDLGDLVGFDAHRVSCFRPIPDACLRAAASCTLPSYTVLPIRATTPPSSSGSTLTDSSTFLPVTFAEALFERLRLFRRQRRRARHVGAHDVLVRQQALAKGRHQVRAAAQLAALRPAAPASCVTGAASAMLVGDGFHQRLARRVGHAVRG